MMTDRDRAIRLIEAYGASSDRWPDRDRVWMTALVQSDSGLRQALEDAARLDAQLASEPDPTPSQAMMARILEASPRPLPALNGWRLGWLSGAGWATAAAAGLCLGLAVGQQALTIWRAEAALEQASSWGLDETEYLG